MQETYTRICFAELISSLVPLWVINATSARQGIMQDRIGTLTEQRIYQPLLGFVGLGMYYIVTHRLCMLAQIGRHQSVMLLKFDG